MKVKITFFKMKIVEHTGRVLFLKHFIECLQSAVREISETVRPFQAFVELIDIYTKLSIHVLKCERIDMTGTAVEPIDYY